MDYVTHQTLDVNEQEENADFTNKTSDLTKRN